MTSKITQNELYNFIGRKIRGTRGTAVHYFAVLVTENGERKIVARNHAVNRYGDVVEGLIEGMSSEKINKMMVSFKE